MHTRFAILHLASRVARPDEHIEFDGLPAAAALVLASTASLDAVAPLVSRIPAGTYVRTVADEWLKAGMTDAATADLMSGLGSYRRIAALQTAVEVHAPAEAPPPPEPAKPAPATFWERVRSLVPAAANPELDLQWATWQTIAELATHHAAADFLSMRFQACAAHPSPWPSFGDDCASLFDSATLVLQPDRPAAEAWVGACLRAHMVIEPLTILAAYRQTVQQMPMNWDDLASACVAELGPKPNTESFRARAGRDLAAIRPWFDARLAED